MTRQTISAKGKLLCGTNPTSSSETSVKLISKRMGMDDSQAGRPTSDGTFELTLTVDSLGTIEPELWIYTTCAAKTLGIPPGCQRLQKIKVPSSYINSGRPYDLGTQNLATKASDEEQDCTGSH